MNEWSVANRSDSVEVPDFTCEAWKTNNPHKINLEEVGTTGVRKVEKVGDSVQLNVKYHLSGIIALVCWREISTC